MAHGGNVLDPREVLADEEAARDDEVSAESKQPADDAAAERGGGAGESNAGAYTSLAFSNNKNFLVATNDEGEAQVYTLSKQKSDT